MARMNMMDFSERAEELIQEWCVAKFEAKRGPNGKDSFLKREAYRLLKQYIDADRQDIFLRAIEMTKRREERQGRKGRRAPTSAIIDQPFKLGLYAMFSDDSLTRNKQKLWGNQMNLAYENDVEPDDLIGFIYSKDMKSLDLIRSV